MISNAWFTVNYFHVSFGKQDSIQTAIHLVNQVENIPIDENLNSVLQKLINSQKRDTVRQLWHFNQNVPHWFLSPWFPKLQGETDAQRKLRIYAESKLFKNKCLYALDTDAIELNPEWVNYLNSNTRVLKDYCHWNL